MCNLGLMEWIIGLQWLVGFIPDKEEDDAEYWKWYFRTINMLEDALAHLGMEHTSKNWNWLVKVSGIH